jgi:hypothetical protein
VSAANVPLISTTGGHIVRVALGAPSRGQILKAMVIQLSGAMDGFTYAFYNSAAGCPPGDITGADTVDPIAQSLAQVCAPRAAATGKDRYMLADGSDGSFTSAGYYENADGGQSNAQRKLYMKLTVPGTGAKTFAVSLGIQPLKS